MLWFLSKLLILVIRGYQKFISPLKPPTCRFYPTCSHYGLEAVKRFGPFKGSWLTIKRILKCHTFHPGGIDPEMVNQHQTAHAVPPAGKTEAWLLQIVSQGPVHVDAICSHSSMPI